MEEFPRVHIVILNWNGWRDTIECLESVFRLDYPNYQVVVCDNNSSDNSVEMIESWASGDLIAETASSHPTIRSLVEPHISKPISFTTLTRTVAESKNQVHNDVPLVIIRTGGNLGFAGGNNVGLRFAQQQRTDYCWLLNNDTVVDPNSLNAMVGHSQRLTAQGRPNTCGSIQCFYDDPDIVQALGGFKINRWSGICSDTFGRYLHIDSPIDHESYMRELDAVHGCSWLIPVRFLEEIGLMEERYFLYYEEIDWATRSKDTFELTYAPAAKIYHKEGSSIGSKSLKKGPSTFSEFYLARSRLKFMSNFFPLRLPFVYASLCLQTLNRLRQKRFANAGILSRVLLGKRSFATD